MSEPSLAELMRREDSDSTHMRSCWHVGKIDLVETTADWCELESPTTYSQLSSRHDGFEVLTKSSASNSSPAGGHNSTLFSCLRGRSTLHLTEPDLESSTPPRGGSMLVMQAPSTSMRSSNNVMEVAEPVDPRHGYRSYESDQLHIYSNEEPTSPVVNCIGQVRHKKKPKQRRNIAKKSEPGASSAEATTTRNSESLMVQGTKL